MRACISIMRAVCSYAYAIAASIAAFSGGVSCQRDHAGAVDIDAGRVCLAAPPACCLENAPFESRCLTPSPLASPGGHMGGHAARRWEQLVGVSCVMSHDTGGGRPGRVRRQDER